jgi:excisionase family DNA binding protein
MEDKKYNAKQIAELLQVNYQSVQKWARSNKIPHYKVGVGKAAEFRFDKNEILEFFRSKGIKETEE